MQQKTRNACSASKSASNNSSASRRRLRSLNAELLNRNARAVAGSVRASWGLRATRRNNAHSAPADGSTLAFADAATGAAAIAGGGTTGGTAIGTERGTTGTFFIIGSGKRSECPAQGEALGLGSAPQRGAGNGISGEAQARRGEFEQQPRSDDGNAHLNWSCSLSCRFSRQRFTSPANLLVACGASWPRFSQ